MKQTVARRCGRVVPGVIAALVLAPLAAPGRVDAATAPTAPAWYRIAAGEITYAGDVTRSCSYPNGECHDYSGGYVESSMTEHATNSTKFSVHEPGTFEESDPGSPLGLAAGLDLGAWSHSYTYVRNHSRTPCGAPATQTLTDGALNLSHTDTDPSVFSAALTLEPGASPNAFTLALQPRQDTEPRFGWVYPAGLRWVDSSQYPTLTGTWTGTGPEACAADGLVETSILDRAPFDTHPFVDRTDSITPVTYDPPTCVGEICTIRAHGKTEWSYDAGAGEDDFTGQHSIAWWFDIEVLTGDPDEEPACRNGVDDDGDGVADYPDDPGCAGADDPDELSLAACDNGEDDDGDGLEDFRWDATGDPGCESLTDDDETDEGCDSVGADHRYYTTMTARTELDVALSPDPHLGTLTLGIPWCMTRADGPRIMDPPQHPSGPAASWTDTQNWILLGALKAFAGITVEQPQPPVVVHGPTQARVTTALNANLDGAALALSAVPVGKLFKPMAKGLKRYAEKLNPLARQLKRFHTKVSAATKTMTKAGNRVRNARATLDEVRRWIAETEAALAKAETRADKHKLKKELEHLEKVKNAAKRVERITSLEYQESIRKLRVVKRDEHKVARKVDAVLKKVRAALDRVGIMKKRLYDEIDEAVAAVRPGWAREVAQEAAAKLKAKLDAVFGTVRSKVEQLTAQGIVAVLRSNRASAQILDLLQNAYATGISRLTHIPIPIWNGELSVSFDQNGNPSVADNSTSRLIFTVRTTTTLHTSD